MSDGPKKLDGISGWQFERWEYDGAPLAARRVPRTSREDDFTVEIDEAGDLVFDGLPYEGARPFVPGEVLSRLVADAIERKAPGWTGPVNRKDP